MPLDFVVLTAAGGAECLTLIEGIQPDLFLVDISMPGMNGWQLVSRLREPGQTAPIIMLSANIGERPLEPTATTATTIRSPSPSTSASCTTSWRSISA